jgi:hypothetical protein
MRAFDLNMVTTLLFLCLLLSTFQLSAQDGLESFTTPQLEREALAQFFLDTHGRAWLNKYGWESLLNESSTTDPCQYPYW